MIGTYDIKINAAKPNMPLAPMYAYAGSPSSLRIRDVPKSIGQWNITEIQISIAYPDNSIKTANCVRIGNVWVGTIDGCSVSGESENGLTVYANGIDENGQTTTGYILGKGSVNILACDGTITPTGTSYYVHMKDERPTNPQEGDLWQEDGSWYIWQDGEAYPIGDESGEIAALAARVGALETTITQKADKTQLAQYEQKSELRTDVGNIVTERAFTDWNYPEKIGSSLYGIDEDWIRQNGDHNETYYIMNAIWNATGDDRWIVALERYSWDDSSDWLMFDYQETPVSAPEDTLTLNCSFYIDTDYVPVVLSRESQNALGIAMMSDLDAKQDKLTDPQISAIDSVVDERATTITFDLVDVASSYNWSGEINVQTLVDAGIYDATQQTWLMQPKIINIGTGVTGIGANAFAGCATLKNVTIPDSVTSIGASAFSGCDALASVTIGNGLKNVGNYAFQNCSVLGQVTLPANVNPPGVDAFAGTPAYFYLYLVEAVPNYVPGSANYPWGVSNTDHIKTIRNATIEWVTDQGYGKGCDWRDVTVNNRTHKCNIYPFQINQITIDSAKAEFEVVMTNYTTYNIARDAYFVITLGNFEQPMTWANAQTGAVPFDMFEGGSASAIAPKPNTTNIYHIYEYKSGHLMVEKFGAAYDKLGDIETLINAI